MTLDEIKAALHSAQGVRIPRFGPDDRPQQKVAALEDHILLTAWHKAELEEARYWAIEAGKALSATWDRIEGHQAMLPRASRATKEQVDAAKRAIKPETWDALQEARTLVEALTRQISRLGGSDYEAASRAYTLMTGS